MVARRLETERPESNAGVGVTVEALQEPVVSRVRPALLVLAGSVAFVLLIACANVTSLLLAQGLSRGKEVAIRAASGRAGAGWSGSGCPRASSSPAPVVSAASSWRGPASRCSGW